MAFRRQKLTQRRKTVGFTQESLAEHLGVERSTVIRWEAGDSEPLPSIRPSLARALQVSIDELADLLAGSEDASVTQALAAEPGETAPRRPAVQPPVRMGGPGLGNLSDPKLAETVEALRRALWSAGANAEDLAAMLLADESSRASLGATGPDDSEPPRTGSLNRPAPITVPPEITSDGVPRRGFGPRRRKRFVVAGVFVLALPAVWLSPPFGFSHSGASVQASSAVAPVLVSPAPNLGAVTDKNPQLAASPEVVSIAPVVAPVSAASPAAAAPAPRTARTTGNTRTVRRSTRPTMRPPARPEWVGPATVAADRWGGYSQMKRFDHLW